jgi:hypothetical protein
LEVKEMREGGVYALPDGRELIALSGGRYGFYKLFDPLAWKYQGPAMYETDAKGMIMSLGRPTPWRVRDLREVGEAAAPIRH